jgi:hypothetical protein
MVSCSNNAPYVELPFRWNIYEQPSVSEFDRNKTAKPTTEQVKKSLQLLADETAKDPESLKVRKISVGDFVFLMKATSGKKIYGHKVQADTDSKNSYGGYEGYKTKLFLISKPGAMARQITGSQIPLLLSRESIEVMDKLKQKRKELSDEEFVKWLGEGFDGEQMYPEKKGRKDTYVYPRPAMDAVWWIPKRP